MERAIVVFNPVAGRGRATLVAELAAADLERRGVAAERVPTVPGDGAVHLVRERADAIDLCVVIGGDGSLRQAVAGLGERAREVVLGLVPMGNGNLVARELGIPLEPAAAVAALAHATPVSIDVGAVDGEPFVGVVGVGWDAQAVRLLDRWRHTRVGGAWYRAWADSMYVAAGAASLWQVRAPRLELKVEDERRGPRYRALIASTCRTYGKGWSMTPDACIGSGRLHYQARKSAAPPLALWQVLAAVRRRRAPAFVSDYGAGTRLVVASDRPVPVQIDGDYLGLRTTLAIELVPCAARVLAPARTAHALPAAAGAAYGPAAAFGAPLAPPGTASV